MEPLSPETTVINQQRDVSAKRPRLHYSNIPKAKIERIQQLSLAYIIDANLPFTTFTNPYLKQIFSLFDPTITSLVP